jgi:hypothetical protein
VNRQLLLTIAALLCLAYFLFELITQPQPGKLGYACLAAGNLIALAKSRSKS